MSADLTRRILVDRARGKKTAKRGSDRPRIELTPDVLFQSMHDEG